MGPACAACDAAWPPVTRLGPQPLPRSLLRIASFLLACCNMRTLYLRNVPDDVVERLERLATRHATSVGAMAVRELADASRRADNPALLEELPDLDFDVTAIVADVEAGRAER
jgi:plasmid stability protein